MKGTLHFDLPEERDDFELAQLAGNLLSALQDTQNCVFRPPRKHGFPAGELKVLLEAVDKETNGKGTQLVALMERLFLDILENHDVLDRV